MSETANKRTVALNPNVLLRNAFGFILQKRNILPQKNKFCLFFFSLLSCLPCLRWDLSKRVFLNLYLNGSEVQNSLSLYESRKDIWDAEKRLKTANRAIGHQVSYGGHAVRVGVQETHDRAVEQTKQEDAERFGD